MGHLNSFRPREGEIFQKFKCPGDCPGGCLSFDLTGTLLYMTEKKPSCCFSFVVESRRGS